MKALRICFKSFLGLVRDDAAFTDADFISLHFSSAQVLCENLSATIHPTNNRGIFCKHNSKV